MPNKALNSSSSLIVPGWPERNDMHALLGAAEENERISKDALYDFILELPTLLATEYARITQGESTSLPGDQLARLLESTLYLVGLGLHALSADAAIAHLTATPAKQLLLEGKGAHARKIRAISRYGKIVSRAALAVPHSGYQFANYHAIRAFFSTYDADWGAHELNWTPTYLPCLPLPEVGGILYLAAYLEAMQIENRICRIAPHQLLCSLCDGAKRQSDAAAPIASLAEELDPAGDLAAQNLCAMLLDHVRRCCGGDGRIAAEQLIAQGGLNGRSADYVRRYFVT